MNLQQYSDVNRYDDMALDYQKSDTKPDKQYSILPTVLYLIGDVKDKICVDAGCGSGFFTVAIAKKGAEKVIGIDNSQEQILLAKQHPYPNVEYILGDIFKDTFPANDVFVAPFVLNFPTTKQELKKIAQKIHASLSKGGRLIAVVDHPNDADLQRFGAKKFIHGQKEDEAPIIIELFNHNQKICTLHSTYFSPETIEKVLTSTGFNKVTWYNPIITEDGVVKMGEEFWRGYADNPELLYLVAEKA